MTAYAYLTGNGWVEIVGTWASMLGDHDEHWLASATAAERQRAGAFPITDGQLAPHPHQRKLGEVLVDVSGEPHRVGIFEDLTLDERKTAMSAQLHALWHEHELGGFTGPGGRVPTDEETQRRLLVALVAPAEEPIAWEVRPDEFVLVDAVQVASIADAVFGHAATCANHARELLAVVLAAKSHAALSAIDLSNGWPP